jgi:HK97 family phage major capsid protein
MKTIRVARVQQRAFDIELGERKTVVRSADGEERRRYPVSFSSEMPARKWSWEGEYLEVLSHEKGDVDLSAADKGLPMLKSHQRLLHCGSIWDVANDEKKKRLSGDAEFSSIPLGQEEETKVVEGHTRTVSVGYEYLPGMKLIGTDEETGLPIYLFRWRPLEVSLEPIPADQSVGFGRKHPAISEEDGEPKQSDAIEFAIEERAAQPLTEGDGIMGRTIQPGGTPETPVMPVVKAPAERMTETERNAEVAGILEMAKAHGLLDRAIEWIRGNMTKDQIAQKMLEAIRTKGPGQPAAEALEDMPPKDLSRYSVVRAVRMHVETVEGKRGGYDGLEAEVHQELFKTRAGIDHGGIRIPLRQRPGTGPDQLERTLGTTEATGGATLVGQTVVPDMIEFLKNQAFVIRAGAKVYTGLRDILHLNRKTGVPTVQWMAENPVSGVTGTEPTFGYVDLSPKTMIGKVTISRQLLATSSIDHENDIRADLAEGTGLAIDLAACHGTGTDKQPVGIYSAAGVQAWPCGGVPDLTDLTTMVGMAADKNADFGAQAFATTPLMAAVFMRTPVISGQWPMIWTGPFREGKIIGFPAYASNQISKTLEASTKHGLIFGNWNDLAIGSWGNDIELIVDIVTRADYGQVVITSFAMGDVAILRPESFVKGTGATIA